MVRTSGTQSGYPPPPAGAGPGHPSSPSEDPLGAWIHRWILLADGVLAGFAVHTREVLVARARLIWARLGGSGAQLPISP